MLMKKIILLFTLILTALASMAQSTGTSSAPAKADLKDGQVLVGLYTSDNYEKFGVALGSNMLLQAGSRITEKYYAGMSNLQVEAVRFALAESTEITKVRLYAFTSESNIVGPIATKEWGKTCDKGWNIVEFDKPVVVKDTYIALLPTYEFKQTMSNVVIATSFEPKEPSLAVYGPLRTDSNDSFWAQLNAQKYGSTAIQLVCRAQDLSGTRVSPDGYVSNTVTVGETYQPTLSVNCTSDESINTIDYTLAIGDKTVQKTHTFEPAIPAGFNQRYDFVSEVTAPNKAGAYALTFTIDKVNGKAVSGQATAQYKQLVVTRKAHRMSLVEEFTGTECGWCPRGWVGMEKVKHELPDDACVIAMHLYSEKDPMYGSYYHMPSFIGGAPAAVIDRAPRSVDPYFGTKIDGKDEGIINAVMRHEALLPEVEIQNLSANFTDDACTHVLATATTEFLTDLDGSQIIFVLTADGVTGTTDAWKQTNFYASIDAAQNGLNADTDPELYKLCRGQEMGQTYVPLTYNDVMIGSSWLTTTTPNEVLAFTTTKAGEKASSIYTLAMPTKSILRKAINNDEVYVTAFVLKADGTVANAARCKVSLTPEAGNRTGNNRCMVAEDATGTWCGWCPKGIVTMERMRKELGDKFIGISVHCGDDPMNTYTAYAEWLESLGIVGYPTVFINRDGLRHDPNYSAIKNIYEDEFRKYSELDVKADFAIAGDELKMTATVTPLMDLYATDYTVAFVVMEDGPTGWQDNFYFDGASGEMGGFEKLPRKAQITYVDVARGVWPTVTGLGTGAITLPADMKAGEGVRKTCSVPLSYFKYEDLSKIHVAALVIRNNGEIENAAEAWGDLTSIHTVLADDAQQGRIYDLSGRLVTSSHQGVSISGGKKTIR